MDTSQQSTHQNAASVTLVERATGCLLIAKLADHSKAELKRQVSIPLS
jgi:hypothetical protein